MKVCHFLISILLIFSLLPIHCLATNNVANSNTITLFDDGSYIIINMSIVDSRSNSVRTASKTYTYVNLFGVEKWKATIVGSFTFNGVN